MICPFGPGAVEPVERVDDLQAVAAPVPAETGVAYNAVIEDPIREMRFQMLQHRREAIDWFTTSANPYHDMYMLKLALSPEIELMRDLVARQGTPANLQRLHNIVDKDVTGFEFPMVYVASGKPANKFQSNALQHLTNKNFWAHLPQTVATSNTVSRMICRAAAVVFQLMQQQTQRFPTRLFRLIVAGPNVQEAEAHILRAEAAKFLALRDCVLDRFSQSFRQQYSTVDDNPWGGSSAGVMCTCSVSQRLYMVH